MITAPAYHVPVLLGPTVDGLDLRPGGVYVDATFGGGGHSREILSRLGPEGRLYGFDQDADAAHNAPQGDARFTFVRTNFRYLRNWMRYYGEEQIDGLLADLGVSSHHFDDERRGFSFRFDGPLDMRMNTRSALSAADVVNTYTAGQLEQIFRLYGELRCARRLAASVVSARAARPLATVAQFMEVAAPLLERSREKKDMAKVFQALRIEVNHELDALTELLQAATSVLRPGGRLVVLTYHSLEDRLVKNFIRAGNVSGRVDTDFYGNRLAPLRPVNSKVIVPDAAEQERNPRSRSAKLRIAEKIDTES